MNAELKEHIKEKCEWVIQHAFSKTITFNVNLYADFLNEQRLKEINSYREYHCISPTIYNLVYFYMRDQLMSNRDDVVVKLSPHVRTQQELYVSRARKKMMQQVFKTIENEEKESTNTYWHRDDGDYTKNKYPDHWPKKMKGAYD